MNVKFYARRPEAESYCSRGGEIGKIISLCREAALDSDLRVCVNKIAVQGVLLTKTVRLPISPPQEQKTNVDMNKKIHYHNYTFCRAMMEFTDGEAVSHDAINLACGSC